jgi:hypothetical protein
MEKLVCPSLLYISYCSFALEMYYFKKYDLCAQVAKDFNPLLAPDGCGFVTRQGYLSFFSCDKLTS